MSAKVSGSHGYGAVVCAMPLSQSLAKLLVMSSFLQMKLTLSPPAVIMSAPILVFNSYSSSLNVYSIVVVVGAPLSRLKA